MDRGVRRRVLSYSIQRHHALQSAAGRGDTEAAEMLTDKSTRHGDLLRVTPELLDKEARWARCKGGGITMRRRSRKNQKNYSKY
jgi:hypothetical protein